MFTEGSPGYEQWRLHPDTPSWLPCDDLAMFSSRNVLQFTETEITEQQHPENTVARCNVTNLTGSVVEMLIEASEKLDGDLPAQMAERHRYINRILSTYLAVTGVNYNHTTLAYNSIAADVQAPLDVIFANVNAGMGSSNENEMCTNTCMFEEDDECDDGGQNSVYWLCALGTDCADCGPRAGSWNSTAAHELEDRTWQRPSCPPGYQATAIDARYCSPCPEGYRADTSSPSNCSACPIGSYQPAKGQLECTRCPSETLVTGQVGATKASDCSVPRFSLRPTLPRDCTPNVCNDAPTPVDAYWAIESVEKPDEEAKEVGMAIFVEMSWDDPRPLLDASFAEALRETADTFAADGLPSHGNMTLTTADWRARGFWLPRYTIQNAVSGTDAIDSDDDVDVSNVTVLVSPFVEGAGASRLWDSQRSTIRVIWTRHLTQARLRWTDLDWFMFPFGRLQLAVGLSCRAEADCLERQYAESGKYADQLYAEEHFESDPTMPLIAGSLQRSATFPDCPCLTSYPAAVDTNGDGTVSVRASGVVFAYPDNYGLSSCKDHDRLLEPFCNTTSPPGWCSSAWCYVDPAACNMLSSASGFFNDQHVGANVEFSYAACGASDTFSSYLASIRELPNGTQHGAGRRLSRSTISRGAVAALRTRSSSSSTSVDIVAAQMQISLILRREARLKLVRLIIPTILIMLLGVVVFFVKDTTWTVDMTFSVLLVLTVIAVEVDDFFPGHVTYMSWIDYFIFANTILVVINCGLGIWIIILTEAEEKPRLIKLGESLDLAMAWVQPFIAILTNLLLLSFAMLTTEMGQAAVDSVNRMYVTCIVANALILFVATAGIYTGKLYIAGAKAAKYARLSAERAAKEAKSAGRRASTVASAQAALVKGTLEGSSRAVQATLEGSEKALQATLEGSEKVLKDVRRTSSTVVAGWRELKNRRAARRLVPLGVATPTEFLVADTLFNAIDTNGDGTIEPAELLEYMLSKGEKPSAMHQMLMRFDTSGDGTIDRNEWRKGFLAGFVGGAGAEVGGGSLTSMSGGASAGATTSAALDTTRKLPSSGFSSWSSLKRRTRAPDDDAVTFQSATVELVEPTHAALEKLDAASADGAEQGSSSEASGYASPVDTEQCTLHL